MIILGLAHFSGNRRFETEFPQCRSIIPILGIHIRSLRFEVKLLNTIFNTKRDLLIIAFFAFLGTGGVIAAASISINSASPISLGAGYAAVTACDANVTLSAKTAVDPNTGQLYVATIALSNISQNATTGCGNKTMELALKINGQMTYASWDIPAASTDSTFNFTGATNSISDYNAMTALTPFQADGLTNIAITKIGSFSFLYSFTAQTGSGSRDWRSVTSSSDGTKLAAVVSNGFIYTSTDSGVTWMKVTNSVVAGGAGTTTRNWSGITSSSDGTKLAALVKNGYIYTSSDSGATWTEQTGSGTRNWEAITSSSDGTKLAAIVQYGFIYTSTDSGVTWTQRATSTNWVGITSSSDGTKLAATAYMGNVHTSTDSGVTWTSRYSTFAWSKITSSSDGTKLAATTANSGLLYTSTDSGINWTIRSSEGRAWQEITSSSDGTMLAAVVGGGYLYTSTDSGVTWTEQSSAGSRSWLSITSSSDGTKLAAGGSSGYIYTGLSAKTRSSN